MVIQDDKRVCFYFGYNIKALIFLFRDEEVKAHLCITINLIYFTFLTRSRLQAVVSLNHRYGRMLHLLQLEQDMSLTFFIVQDFYLDLCCNRKLIKRVIAIACRIIFSSSNLFKSCIIAGERGAYLVSFYYNEKETSLLSTISCIKIA
jgi:hypothetical protein